MRRQGEYGEVYMDMAVTLGRSHTAATGWGRSDKERTGEEVTRYQALGGNKVTWFRSHRKVSYLQMGMAVGTGKATAHVCGDPRHPGPGKGCCGSGGNDGLPELN